MTPADSPPPERTGDKSPGPRQQRTTHGQWTLTQQAFEKLLASFSADRDEAGRQYEVIRTKLVRFLQSRLIDSAEERADDTINRVARRIDEGQKIDNLVGYMYRTAYLVFLEATKEPTVEELDPERAPSITDEPSFEDSEWELRLRCFDNCLDKLTAANRELILGYYQEEGRAKIEFRKQIADRLSIPLNALRIRAHRLRMGLEGCINDCLGQLA
jgi:DNA-directed RNA polymerase specialized sigma24 family protein